MKNTSNNDQMPFNLKSGRWPVLLCLLVAFSLPFFYKITTVLLFLLGLSLITLAFKNKPKINKKILFMILPWGLFFLFYSAGYFYSTSKSTSLSEIETKLAMLALPVLIGFFLPLSKSEITRIFKYFIYGLSLFQIISLIFAFHLFITTGSYNGFFYHQLTQLSDINASYMSWYVLFAIILLLGVDFGFSRAKKATIISLQLIFFGLLSSISMGLVFLLIVIPFYFISTFSNKIKGKKQVFYLLVACCLLIIIITFPIQTRVQSIDFKNSNIAFLESYDHHSYEFDNLSNRLFFWRVSVENLNLRNIITGVGNGDVKQVQNQKMHDLGIINISDRESPSDFTNVSVHNMYLESLLAGGIFTFLLFLVLMALPFKYILERDNFDHTWFLFSLTAGIFMLLESALQTQAGVVFFSFFSILFYKLHLTEIQNDEKVSFKL